MKTSRNLICIGCPMGCSLTVTLVENQVTSVEGNFCKRGEQYARREVVSPTRILTTTLPVINSTRPTVSVKTAGEIPKSLLMECIRALRNITLTAPVHTGQVVYPNILKTGVDIIATADALEKNK
ncbi:MAG: DUF1667 domain-containing protein [Oscillospiraceae bacterium]|nr:DUF1667 domain-containing protein [Oscillospiraceae bacterium]